MKVSLLAFLGSLATLLCQSSILANSYESRETINQVVKAFVAIKVPVKANERLDVVMKPLDSRIKLTRCEEMPKAFLPHGQYTQMSTVGVKCKGEKPWQVYVPVKIQVLSPVVVASHVIARGQTIRVDDLKIEMRDRNRLRSGFYKEKSQLIGKLAKRTIRDNIVITPNFIKHPKIVKRGESVLIIANLSGLQVRMKGEAKQNGILNEKIRVYNPSSKKIIEAIVVGPGKVQVNI